jgi:cobalt-zinc-cadmium efflux system protein
MAEHRHFHTQGEKRAIKPGYGIAPLTVGIVLNLGFVVIEGIYGLLANSMALLADAGHNLGDALGLAIAWIAIALARGEPSQKYTYGLRRGTILAALANAMLLLVAVGALAFEAFRRLGEPAEIASATVMGVGAAGIAVNGITAWLLAAGRKNDINLRAAFLHMVYDALVSLGVVVTGAIMWVSGWAWLDSAASLAIAAVILAGTWSLLRFGKHVARRGAGGGQAERSQQLYRAAAGRCIGARPACLADEHDRDCPDLSLPYARRPSGRRVPGEDRARIAGTLQYWSRHPPDRNT